MRIVLALLLIMTSGCSFLPTGMGLEAKHDSGLLTDGRDSDGLLKEDSLDVIIGYLYWERPASAIEGAITAGLAIILMVMLVSHADIPKLEAKAVEILRRVGTVTVGR